MDLAKHQFERSDFCDFEKPREHACQKEKIEVDNKSKERGQQNEIIKKSGVTDKVNVSEKSIVAGIVQEPDQVC